MKLTDIKGVAAGLPRTPDGARRAIWRYEQANLDLDPQTRRMMAVAACGRYFGRRNLEAALGQALPNYPFRDWSWRWWNILNLAGLGHYWDDFAQVAAHEGVRHACTNLRKEVTPQAYLEVLRRAGTNPHNNNRPLRWSKYWTKGGTWDVRSNLARIPIGHEHLPERPCGKRWQLTLGPERVQLLEREVMHLAGAGAEPPSIIRERAVEYVRHRISEMLGYKKPMGYHAAAWFFQQPILDPAGRVLVLKDGGRYVVERLQGQRAYKKRWSW